MHTTHIISFQIHKTRTTRKYDQTETQSSNRECKRSTGNSYRTPLQHPDLEHYKDDTTRTKTRPAPPAAAPPRQDQLSGTCQTPKRPETLQGPKLVRSDHLGLFFLFTWKWQNKKISIRCLNGGHNKQLIASWDVNLHEEVMDGFVKNTRDYIIDMIACRIQHDPTYEQLSTTPYCCKYLTEYYSGKQAQMGILDIP